MEVSLTDLRGWLASHGNRQERAKEHEMKFNKEEGDVTYPEYPQLD